MTDNQLKQLPHLEEMNKEDLIKIINQERRAKEALFRKRAKLGLSFETPNNRKDLGKPNADENIADVVRKNIPYLKRRDDKTITTDENATTHTLIKGDNFPALLALHAEYKNAVDVIYIDPPYNTGNQDFIYNDRYVEREDRFKHSRWLGFMARRLLLAQELLSENGVIFVSIDDNEQAHLKMLMDEIFGADNALNQIIWAKGNAQNDASHIQKNHELILAYAKTRNQLTLRKETKKIDKILKDERGYYKFGGITTGGAGGTLNSRPKLGYTFYYNPKTKDALPIQDYDENLARTSNDESEVYTTKQELVDQGYTPIRAPKKGSLLGCWTWGFEKAVSSTQEIHITENLKVKKKIYLDLDENLVDKDGKYSQEISTPVRSVLELSSSAGSRSLVEVFGDKVFNNSKPVDLITELISYHPNKSAIVLDFFAGSGTTGHAVAALNAEDGGTRKCILVTDAGKTGDANNADMSGDDENAVDIAEDITYERMRRVLTGEDWANPGKATALNQNLEMLKVGFFKETVPSSRSESGLVELTGLEIMMRLEEKYEDLGLDEEIAELYAQRAYNRWVKFAKDEKGDLEQWD